MVGVTWWTAYAYASWRGRDLATEEEWEAAARGNRGFKYPWGDELKLGRMNSNDGFQAMKRGSYNPSDGYNYWSAVDTFTDDESPFKVIGMAGNVAEWVYKNENKRQVAIVKGGSFATSAVPLYGRLEKLEAEDCWFIYPEANKPAGNIPPRPGEAEREFAGDKITAGTRSLYIGFRTVKRK
jgi:formylglycine-generating enzyme required for sulfatase activity